MRRIEAGAALLALTRLVAAGLTAVLIVRLTGFDYWYPMAQIMAFMPYYALAGVLVVVAFLVQKRWYAVALSGLVAVVMTLFIAPRLVHDGGATPAGARIRVMSVNLRVGGADVAEIAALADREGVDVIAFQEFTPQFQARFDAVDPSRFSYRSLHPRELALGSAIYSRVPMVDAGVRRHRSGFSQAQGVLDIAGVGPVRIESAHPCAPTGPARSACWKADLADQPPAGDGGNAQILLGDFNATLDHAAMRKLLSAGYTDAASSAGMGLVPTWPFDKPIPKITIDHVLVNSRVSAGKFAVHSVGGTDHHCIIADLTIREP